VLVLHDILKFCLHIITVTTDHKAKEKMSHLMKTILFLFNERKTQEPQFSITYRSRTNLPPSDNILLCLITLRKEWMFKHLFSTLLVIFYFRPFI